MSKLETSKTFLSLGIATIPLRHRGKEPESNLMGGTWERYKTQLPTEYDLNRWLASGWQNYGVVAGWDNLAVIDFDNADALAMWLDYFAMINRHAEVYPMPYMVTTARGAHVYVRMYNVGANQKRQGVDVKVHGYVVGPGSTHPSGIMYQAVGTEYQFPDVFDLDTILPQELFPLVAAPTTMEMPVLPFLPIASHPEDYDPFEIASQTATGSLQGVDLITKVKSYVRIETMFPDAFSTSGDRRWLACKCPFHDDNKPSFWIDTVRQLCGCQVCEMKPMDAVNLYAKMHSMSESAAVSAMAKEVGVWG